MGSPKITAQAKIDVLMSALDSLLDVLKTKDLDRRETAAYNRGAKAMNFVEYHSSVGELVTDSVAANDARSSQALLIEALERLLDCILDGRCDEPQDREREAIELAERALETARK